MKKEMLTDNLNIKDNNNLQKRTPWGVAYEKNKTPSGKTVFKKLGENKITLGLAQEVTKSLINEKDDVTKINTLDDEEDLNLLDTVEVLDEKRIMFGFGLSIDGGHETHIKPVKKFEKGYSLDEGLIPLRMIELNDHDLEDMVENNGYHVRDHYEELDEDYMRYFIKEFESVELRNIQEGGDQLSDYPHETLIVDMNVYSIIDFELEIDVNDMAEYFGIVEDDINNRRFNSITIFMGEKCEKTNDNGDTVESYCNIIASNRMNIRQRNLGEVGARSIVYRIYV